MKTIELNELERDVVEAKKRLDEATRKLSDALRVRSFDAPYILDHVRKAFGMMIADRHSRVIRLPSTPSGRDVLVETEFNWENTTDDPVDQVVMFVFQIRRPDVVETILADGTQVVRSERPRKREVRKRQVVEMPQEAAL